MKKKRIGKILSRILYWVLLTFCAVTTVGTLLNFVPVLSDIASNLFIPLYGYILVACLALALLALFTLLKEKTPRNIIHLIASLLICINFAFMSIWLVYTVNEQGAKINYFKAFTLQRFDYVQSVDETYTDQNKKEVPLSIYYCDDGNSGKPVMVYIHGGGWIWGSRQDRLSTTKTFAERGYVVVCPDYDLSGDEEHLYNSTEKQLLCALRWAEKNAAKFGGNTERLYLVGDSAGGNMALDISYKINGGVYKDCPRVSRVSVIYPVTDIRAFYENDNIVTSATSKKMAVSYLGATPEEEPERYAQFNPAKYIGSATPPTLIVACESDGSVPLDSTVSFAQALVKNKTDIRLVTVPFANHAVDWQANNFLGQAYINNTLEWFNK
ncbi:MAG: alpha/beta hydrolase [Clostridia bacterium]|nr:alpha/beta hydrolase [Clostridia bacterium]